jgi:hypothetical protein
MYIGRSELKPMFGFSQPGVHEVSSLLCHLKGLPFSDSPVCHQEWDLQSKDFPFPPSMSVVIPVFEIGTD